MRITTSMQQTNTGCHQTRSGVTSCKHVVRELKIARFSIALHWIRFSRKTARFGFVDRVHVPRIARTRATYRFFRLELRNIVLFRSSKLHLWFSSYYAVTNSVSGFMSVAACLQQSANTSVCIYIARRAHVLGDFTLVELPHVRSIVKTFGRDGCVRLEFPYKTV